MIYGAAISLEPFMLLASRDYKDQAKLAIQHKQRGLPLPSRFKPMLPYREEKTLLTLSFMLCMAVGAAVLLMCSFHLYLTLTAQTTVEFHANFANKRRAKQSGQKWKNPYSRQSARANFEQVFGGQRPWFLALLPSTREPDFLPVPIPGYVGENLSQDRLQGDGLV
jgi:hypothetical protein